MNPLVYNFTLLEQTPPEWTPHNRAFCYGDGLFETMLFHQGEIRFWNAHYHRLRAGMQALWLQPPPAFHADSLETSMRTLLQKTGLATARLRLQVWRKPGGLYTPTTNDVDFLITATACLPPAVSVIEKVAFFEAVRLSHTPYSAFKTCNALPYVLAGIARAQAGADDLILLDTEGHVAECIASNLFWYQNHTVFTPSLRTGCIAGIVRGQLLQRIEQTGYTLREGEYRPEALLAADGAFCCNVAGIQWLAGVGQHRFPVHRDLTIEQRLFPV